MLFQRWQGRLSKRARRQAECLHPAVFRADNGKGGAWCAACGTRDLPTVRKD